MKHLGLFEGIGGFALAARWMDWTTEAWVEINPFCQKVLYKNFPLAKGYSDIKTFDGKKYRHKIDIITAGFPCQPFSIAGEQRGEADKRYLWEEMLRVIREIQPSWVVGENVNGILNMDNGAVFEKILTSLESEGYKIQTFVIPACSTGAPHRRNGVWIVANRDKISNDSQDDSNDSSKRELQPKGLVEIKWRRSMHTFKEDWLSAVSKLCGMDDGLPKRLDKYRRQRIEALGNSIVPHIAYNIFYSINTM